MYDRVYPSLRQRLLTYLRNAVFFLVLGVAAYLVVVFFWGLPEDVKRLRDE